MYTFKVGDKVRAIPGTRNPDGTDFFSDGKIEDVMPHAIIVQWESTGQYTRHTHNQLKKVNAMTDRKNHLENLKAIRSNVDLAIKQVEEEIEKGHPSLAQGQVWRHSNFGNYIVAKLPHENMMLIHLELGSTWAGRDGFGDPKNEKDFTYIGCAQDVLFVRAN